MATIPELVEMALEEIGQADRDGAIPNSIKFHQSADAMKPWSHVGDYDDHGNFTGSLTMYMLLFASEYGLIEQGNFEFLKLLNGCGDREEPLRFEGKLHQKSGKGPNNYRTNLLEALLPCEGCKLIRIHFTWLKIQMDAGLKIRWQTLPGPPLPLPGTPSFQLTPPLDSPSNPPARPLDHPSRDPPSHEARKTKK